MRPDRLTPDQQTIADSWHSNARTCALASNGIGKTWLAAKLLTDFAAQFPDAICIWTAPTQRQVEQLLWPEIRRRLPSALQLRADSLPSSTLFTAAGRRFAGFATRHPERFQGFHGENLAVVVDEASGIPDDIAGAIIAVAVGATNKILAIGNPTNTASAFFKWSRSPAWSQCKASALSHPNILAADDEKEPIPGAVSLAAFKLALTDWCTPQPAPTADTFTWRGSHFLPNDQFRVRFLGQWPREATNSLISPAVLAAQMIPYESGSSPRLMAVDIARLGGDRTVIGTRIGNTVTSLRVLPPATLPEQAATIAAECISARPDALIVDASGLGIGVFDLLGSVGVPVVPFIGAESPSTPYGQSRFANRRAECFSLLADALRSGNAWLPNSDDLALELQCQTFSLDTMGRILMAPKRSLADSPDLADTVSMLWSPGFGGSAFNAPVRRRRSSKW